MGCGSRPGFAKAAVRPAHIEGRSVTTFRPCRSLPHPLQHELTDHGYVRGMGPWCFGPRQAYTQRSGKVGRLYIEVPNDLHMVGYETDRDDQHIATSRRVHRAEMIEDVGLEPRLRRWAAAALIRELPSTEPCTLCNEA